MITVPLRPAQLKKGLPFARFVKSLAIADGDFLQARAVAEGRNWGDSPGVVTALKAAVSAVTVGNTAGYLRRVIEHTVQQQIEQFAAIVVQRFAEESAGASANPGQSQASLGGRTENASWTGPIQS